MLFRATTPEHRRLINSINYLGFSAQRNAGPPNISSATEGSAGGGRSKSYTEYIRVIPSQNSASSSIHGDLPHE